MIRKEEAELIGYYHLARTALDIPKRWDRLNWAAKQFHRLHPTVSVIAAYKAVDRLTRV